MRTERTVQARDPRMPRSMRGGAGGWRRSGWCAVLGHAALALVIAGPFARGAKADDYADCASFDVDRVVAACSRLIDAGRAGGRDLAGLLHNRASARSRSGELDAAKADYDRAVTVSPDWALLYYNRADVSLELGDEAAAVADYETAISLDPNYQKAHYNLGNIYRRKGQTDAAIASFRRAVRINPRYLQAHHHLGRLFARTGDLEQSLEHYDAVVQLSDRDADVLAERGEARLQAGRSEAALADFDEALQRAGSSAGFRARRAIALLRLGRSDDARADLAAVRDAGDRTAVAWLQNRLAVAGRYDGAADGAFNPDLTEALETCIRAADC